MIKNTLDNHRFMGSLDNYNDAEKIIIGAPMDFTCSFKPGSRFGPKKIREVSEGIEEFSFYSNASLEDKLYFDVGDLDIPYGNVNKSMEIMADACNRVFMDDKFPIFIGGEHLITLPLVKEAYKKYGKDLIVFHVDAHADLREDYKGECNSHASVIRRITEFINGKNIHQFGIRSGTKEELDFARNNTNIYLFDILKPLKEVFEKVGSKPVYLTLDVDVVDPAFANGTGTPEPGGCTSKEILEFIIEMKKFNLIGFDLVEISPMFDNSDRTALLGAKIIREILLST